MSAEETTVETVTDEINQVFEDTAWKEGTEEIIKGEVEETAKETTEEKTEETATQETTDEQETDTQGEKGNAQAVSEKLDLARDAANRDAPAEAAVSSRKDEGTLPKDGVKSSNLLARAITAGVSLKDANWFSSDTALEQFLVEVEAAQGAAAEEDTAVPADPFADLPKLDPDVHDAGVIEKFDRLTDIIKDERTANQAMEDRLQTIEGQQQETLQASEQANATEVGNWFNEQCSGLGEDFAGAIGTGKTTSLESGSTQWTNREQIAKQVAVLDSGYRAEGLEPPPRNELFETAARFVLQDEYRQIREKELSGKLEKRAGQHIERVGGRKASASQTPEDFAVAELEKLGIKP